MVQIKYIPLALSILTASSAYSSNITTDQATQAIQMILQENQQLKAVVQDLVMQSQMVQQNQMQVGPYAMGPGHYSFDQMNQRPELMSRRGQQGPLRMLLLDRAQQVLGQQQQENAEAENKAKLQNFVRNLAQRIQENRNNQDDSDESEKSIEVIVPAEPQESVDIDQE